VLEDPHSLPGTDDIVLARARDAHRSMHRDGAPPPGRSSGSSDALRRALLPSPPPPPPRHGGRSQHDGDGEAAAASAAVSDADERRCLGALCDRALARDDSVLAM